MAVGGTGATGSTTDIYLIQGATLKSIAEAIKAKTGGTTVILVGDFAEQIASITTGSNLENANKEVY